MRLTMRLAASLALLTGLALTGTGIPVPQAHARDASALVNSYQPLRPVKKTAHGILVGSEAPPGHIVVKFRRGTIVENTKSRFGGDGALGVKQIFADYGLAEPQPMIPGSADAIRLRRMAAEDRSKMNLPDMALYFEHPIDDPALATQLIGALNAREEVEIAYFQPRPQVASYPVGNPSNPAHTPYALATTPSWESLQDYIESAPGGVDARAAWTLPGGDGTGTQVIDIEYGWQLTHEDLSKGATAVMIGANTTDNDHGTAVLGEIAADRNLFGMTGIAYNADIGYSSVATMSMAAAMDAAVLFSDPGDATLIELHAPGPRYNFQQQGESQRGFVAMEYWQANFDAILNAYAAGVIVCEAAGNGEEDLDDPIYDSLFNRDYRNSHAIICGAGHPPASTSNDRSRLDFSNWGSRLDLQGYGTLVYTLGYADLYNGGTKNSWYTGTFGGTSSASPIVTGSVLCVSGVFQNMLGVTVDADSIRNLLIATGSPQQNPGAVRRIGPRPNLQAALGLLFDPIDSLWFGDLAVNPGAAGAIPISLSNSHPVGDIYLAFDLSAGNVSLKIDSLTRAPRTAQFDQLQLTFDNRFFGQVGYVLRADLGGGTPYLQAGTGPIAYLYVTAPVNALPGQTATVDSLDANSTARLRLLSHFDDKYPDYFAVGTVTIDGVPCDCAFHGDINGDGVINVLDVVLLVEIAFRGGDPAPSDPACPLETRADYNCDGITSVLDAVVVVDIAFRSGSLPCDPCVP